MLRVCVCVCARERVRPAHLAYIQGEAEPFVLLQTAQEDAWLCTVHYTCMRIIMQHFIILLKHIANIDWMYVCVIALKSYVISSRLL